MLRIQLPDGVFVGGLVLLLALFIAAVIGADRDESKLRQIPVRMQALGATDDAPVVQRGDALLVPGGAEREVAARLDFVLPTPDPARSRWVIWFARGPVDALWLQRRDPDGKAWRSERFDYFHPLPGEAVMSAGYLLALPAQWQGPVTLELHARGAVRSALRPRLLREADAMRLTHLPIALNAAAYAGLFMLALIVLVLYVVTHERSFIAAFAAAITGLVFLAGANGHLYQLPGFSLLAAWRSSGLWCLLLLYCASMLQLLLRYAELGDGRAPAARWFERYSLVVVALAAVYLLDLPLLRPWTQHVTTLVWISVAAAAIVILIDAIRRRLSLAWLILAMALIILLSGLAYEAMQRGWLPEMLWTHYGYQFAMVAALALLSLSLLSQIGQYRHERDRDHLARVDSERRMHRESARAALTLTLQTRLRSLPAGDIEWAAVRLMLEHLLPEVPVQVAAVVANGYHGRDLLLVEPAEQKDMLKTDILSRRLPLKRFAADGLPLQQLMPGNPEPYTEALLPLEVRSPGWGLLLLRREGSDGFSTEEMELAGEFVRLTNLHVDEAVATYKLRRSAELDALTGTYNRRSIDQWLVRAFLDASGRDEALSLLFIDIDRFKEINDRLGHGGGDHCLREVAATLRGALDSEDVLGRYGGEEFVALLPGRGGAEARAMGERLRAAVERCQVSYEGHDERVTVSIGVATKLARESTPAAAIERADKALYAAKRGGRNCVHVAPAIFA